MFKSKHRSIQNYSVVTGLYLSNTCLTFSDFTKTPQNGKVSKGSDFSLFQVEMQQLSQNGEILKSLSPDWGSRGRRFKSCHSDHFLDKNRWFSAVFIVFQNFLSLFIFRSCRPTQIWPIPAKFQGAPVFSSDAPCVYCNSTTILFSVSAPVIKWKKTPRKKCSFVAKEVKKR